MKNYVFLFLMMFLVPRFLGAQEGSDASLPSSASGVADAVQAPAGDSKPLLDDNDIGFRDVAKELRCPTCTGLSVLESDASFSVQIKNQVKEQLLLGKDRNAVLEYFVDRYGPWILREPPKKGFNLLAWAVPIALLCFGPVLIWLLVWKRRIHVSTQGVRSNEMILTEMQERLKSLKKGSP